MKVNIKFPGSSETHECEVDDMMVKPHSGAIDTRPDVIWIKYPESIHSKLILAMNENIPVDCEFNHYLGLFLVMFGSVQNIAIVYDENQPAKLSMVSIY